MTLLALLELVRLGQARARQAELFGEIVIERHAVQRARAAAAALERSPETRPTAGQRRPERRRTAES